jgi:hypothetical protein
LNQISFFEGRGFINTYSIYEIHVCASDYGHGDSQKCHYQLHLQYSFLHNLKCQEKYSLAFANPWCSPDASQNAYKKQFEMNARQKGKVNFSVIHRSLLLK